MIEFCGFNMFIQHCPVNQEIDSNTIGHIIENNYTEDNKDITLLLYQKLTDFRKIFQLRLKVVVL